MYLWQQTNRHNTSMIFKLWVEAFYHLSCGLQSNGDETFKIKDDNSFFYILWGTIFQNLCNVENEQKFVQKRLQSAFVFFNDRRNFYSVQAYFLLKGTWSQDRFQNVWQTLKTLGLNKWCGRFFLSFQSLLRFLCLNEIPCGKYFKYTSVLLPYFCNRY